MKKTIGTIVLALLGLVPAFGQKVAVSGTVTDAATGEPLIGVGVIISTGGGTTTDLDGNYSLNVDSNAELTFNLLGFADVVEKVNGRSVINVTMSEDTKFLDEVVVLGYTSQKKNELSSSVVSIKSDQLLDASTPDLGNMLQGKAAGVVVSNASGQPGEGAQIRIRGTGSISASADPLYVVDGIAGGTFNPNDVETVTILKDASATALYGASAAGGVIVITTKSAKNRDRTEVNFRASGGIKKALTGRFHPMSTPELYAAQKSFMGAASFEKTRPASLLDTDFSWMDAAFKIGSVQDYYASVAGVANRVNYFASVDHYDELGTLVSTNYKRNSARVNLSAPIAKNLQMSVKVAYNKSEQAGTSDYKILDSAYMMLPWDYPYDRNTGEPLALGVGSGDAKTRPDDGSTWSSHDPYNFLHSIQYNYNKAFTEEIVADAQVNWTILPWLTFTATGRFSSGNWANKAYTDSRTAEAQVDEAGNRFGSLSYSHGEGCGYGFTYLLKGHKTFGAHDINAIVGYERSRGYTESMGVKGVVTVQGQDAIGGGTTLSEKGEGYSYESGAWAMLAQTQYSFREKYIATASIRYDKTYKFAPKARGGFFPGVSAAWLINKESFMRDLYFMDLLKLRVGYGKVGNDYIEPFLYQDTYTLAAFYNSIPSAVAERQENPNLGWEEAYMASLGIESRLFDRYNISIDLYNTNNTNLLLDVPLAPSSGFTSYTANTGVVNNKGIEFAADADILKNGDWKFNMGINVGHNKNTVVKITKPIERTAGNIDVCQLIQEGEEIYTWHMPKWAGVNPKNGRPQWESVQADGSIKKVSKYSEATYQNCGSASPKLTGGMTANLAWKNWTLNANLSFVYGNLIFNETRYIMDADGANLDYNMMSIDNGLGWSRWEAPGDIATHPKIQEGGNRSSNSMSSRYLEDGSFIRLRNITLAYNLSKPLFKGFIQGGRVYLSADNLFTYSRFSGMDPEVRLESTDWALAGHYQCNYPVPMSVILGIDIKF